MAASSIPVLTIGLTAGASIAQYQPVTAAGGAATAASNAVGFATVAAASGARVPVIAGGTAIAVAGAAINAGDPVKVHTTVTKVVAQGGTGTIIGRALTAAAADGDLIEVLVIPN